MRQIRYGVLRTPTAVAQWTVGRRARSRRSPRPSRPRRPESKPAGTRPVRIKHDGPLKGDRKLKNYFDLPWNQRSSYYCIELRSYLGNISSILLEKNALMWVTAFIDWNAQIHSSGASKIDNPISQASHTLERTARTIGRVLMARSETRRFHVILRLYHGWHKGFQPTPNRKAIKTVVSQTDFSTLSTFPKVVISPDVQYGDQLLAALPERLHARLAIHLPNTLRQQQKNKPHSEKMVDTALAADLLAWANSDPGEWALIFADDDDLVPPLFTAEAWIKPHGGRALLVRSRRSNLQFLKLDGLLIEDSK